MHQRRVPARELIAIGTRLLDAAGSPHEESQAVSEVLVRSNLMGHDSHGVVRLPEYTKWVLKKEIIPGAPFEVIHSTASTAVVDGHYGWGQVVARRAMELAMEKARHSGAGTVTVRNSMHIGRLGEYAAIPVSAAMIGSVLVSSFGGKDMVAPWGGLDPRLSANPLSWAAPTGYDWPFLVDITTSVVPEGKVRVALHSGTQLPAGCLIDHEGNPTTDPAELYKARGGAILAFGGVVGHKGYGLNLVAEFLAGALSGVPCRGKESEKNGNGIFLQAFDISTFIPFEKFVDAVQDFISYVKSSRKAAGVEEILIPGELEYRNEKRQLANGIAVSDGVWKQIEEAAKQLGVTI